MLINLLPDFLAVLQDDDPEDAYHRYFEEHARILCAYWDNYVVEPAAPQFDEIVRDTVQARRDDLLAMTERTDIAGLAAATDARCRLLFADDVDFDIVIMVGVGAANAGELVVDGRGVAFVCLEHFTGVSNSSSHAVGLDPELMPMWLAHEIAHCVRYTAPDSRSEFRDVIAASGGRYSYWETGRRVTLREHLVNEGLAVHAARQFSPGHASWEYFGYERRQFAAIRSLDASLRRAADDDLDHAGLGLRLRFLSGGMSAEARTVRRQVLPERSGYYLGARMVESAVADLGLARALRASAHELTAPAEAARTA